LYVLTFFFLGPLQFFFAFLHRKDLVINIVVADIVATLYSRREPQPPEQLQQLAEYLFKFPFLYQSLRAEPNNTLRLAFLCLIHFVV
jgi:hypothetical protein